MPFGLIHCLHFINKKSCWQNNFHWHLEHWFHCKKDFNSWSKCKPEICFENSNFTLFFKINNLIPFIFSIHVSLITQWLQDSNMLPKSVKVSFFLFLTPRNMSSLTKWYTHLAVPFLSCFCSSKLACLDRGSLGVSTTEDWIVGYRK